MDPRTKLLWKELREPDCQRCGLSEEAQYVCLLGDGPCPAHIIGVGEAPGYREEQKEKPFQGPAGQHLDSVLREVGLSRSEIYFTNAAKCRPSQNRTPTDTELRACRYYLEQELISHKPEWVLILGAAALKSALSLAGVMRRHGSLIQKGGVKYFITIHPSACLHNPSNRPLFLKDMRTFARLVRGELERPKTEVHVVRGPQGLVRMLEALDRADEFAYDLEWWGEPWTKGGITCLGFAAKPGEAWACLLNHPEAHWDKDWRKILRRFKPLLLDRQKKSIAHNGKSDNVWLRACGIPMEHTFDTIGAAHLLDENRPMSLESLSRTILQAPDYKSYADVSLGRDLEGKILAQRNGKDCDYTLRLYHHFRSQLAEQPRLNRIFQFLSMPMSSILAEAELEGMALDEGKLRDATKENETRRSDLVRALRQHVPPEWKELEKSEGHKKKGFKINFNSTQWLGHWLFGPTTKQLDGAIRKAKKANQPASKISALREQRGRPGLGLLNERRTKTGRFSTDEDTLLYLPENHPVIDLLLRYRLTEKNRSTYLEPWTEMADKNGRVHISYNQTGTVTGRMSSYIHTTPRDSFIRSVWGAPEGFQLGQADYSQVEMRLAGMAAQDRTMLRMFALGEDPHTQTAQDLLNLTEVTPEDRKKAKAFNFGFLFGMRERGFQESARKKYGLHFTLGESKQYRMKWMRRYPDIPAWHERQKRLARRYQEVVSRIGRCRRVPDAVSDDHALRAEAERQAINAPIQGFANDLTMFSGVLAREKFAPEIFKIIGFVHDALLFYLKKGHEDEVLPALKYLMENLPLKKYFGVLMTVPLEVEIKLGSHWGEGKVWQPG